MMVMGASCRDPDKCRDPSERPPWGGPAKCVDRALGNSLLTFDFRGLTDMHLFSLIANLRFEDALDILFLSVVAYHLHLWFRGTKAFKALIGLLVLGVVFTVARTWGLFLTTWVFQILWQVLVILLIILFQSEIRQALERVNPLQALGLRKQTPAGRWIQGLGKAVFDMAAKRVGALIIVERSDRVEEWITGGRPLDGDPSPELLMSIFQKGSPLHDGAMLIRNGRVSLVACYLPLSSHEGLPTEWGTRHRAALGLSERCDALIIVISEERGEVSLTRDGTAHSAPHPEALTSLVAEALTPLRPVTSTWWEKIRFLFVHQWPAKAIALGLVSVLWLLLAGQQDFETALSVTLAFKNVPARIEVLEPLHQKVRIRVRGLRKDASSVHEKNVHVALDLSEAGAGKRIFSITREQIHLSNERVHVVSIEPSQVTLKFQPRPSP